MEILYKKNSQVTNTSNAPHSKFLLFSTMCASPSIKHAQHIICKSALCRRDIEFITFCVSESEELQGYDVILKSNQIEISKNKSHQIGIQGVCVCRIRQKLCAKGESLWTFH